MINDKNYLLLEKEFLNFPTKKNLNAIINNFPLEYQDVVSDSLSLAYHKNILNFKNEINYDLINEILLINLYLDQNNKIKKTETIKEYNKVKTVFANILNQNNLEQLGKTILKKKNNNLFSFVLLQVFLEFIIENSNNKNKLIDFDKNNFYNRDQFTELYEKWYLQLNILFNNQFKPEKKTYYLTPQSAINLNFNPTGLIFLGKINSFFDKKMLENYLIKRVYNIYNPKLDGEKNKLNAIKLLLTLIEQYEISRHLENSQRKNKIKL